MRLRKLHLSDFPVASIAPLWVVVPRRDASRVLLGLGGGVCSQSLLSCLALASRMDYSPPGSSPGNFPGKNTGVVCHFLLQGLFLTQESNPDLLLYRQILYQLSYEGLILNYTNCKEFYLLIKSFKEEKSHILLIVMYS